MKKIFQSALFLVFLSLALQAFAIPLEERTPASGGAPLDILPGQPDQIFVPTFGDFKDRFIFTIDGSTLTIIDTETWDEYITQPDNFSDTIADVALLGNGTSLILALENGNLARIELDDETTFVDENADESDDGDGSDDDNNDDTTTTTEPTDSREINSSKNMTSAGITAMAINTTIDNEVVYLINQNGGYYYEYNIASDSLIEVALVDSTTSSVISPVDIVYSSNTSDDQVLITATDGSFLVISPGSGSYSQIILTARDTNDEDPVLGSLALTESGRYAFVLDTANDFVWAYSVFDGEFIDQTTGGTSLDPIEFDATDENSDLTDILLFSDDAEDLEYAYVAGNLGLSVIDVTDPVSRSVDKVQDFDEATDAKDPLDLSATPSLLAASSSDDGYIYSANGDATISVVSDNPFVTISSTSSSSVTEASSTFTVTFQSDEAGTYTVSANSDPTATTGTELIASTALNTADTDVTTASIDINSFSRSAFSEGSNKIFVFVTDAAGHRGRDAVYLTVDRPPGEITITSASFGNERAYVNFTQSTDNDIATYTLYAEPAEDQSNPTCPGNLLFGSADTITDSITPSECRASDCEGIISGLTNNVAYCVAIRATDNSDQNGPVSPFDESVTPEATVGPAGFMGESGCALHSGSQSSSAFALAAESALVCMLLVACRLRKKQAAILICLLSLCVFNSQAQAQSTLGEPVNPEHFTFELRGGLWFPTNSQIKTFVSACCNPIGELEFGYIHDNRYNVTVTAGLNYASGDAVGITNGLASGDQYHLLMVPVRLDFIYRFQFVEQQIFVPFARAGFDSVYFRESSDGASTIQGNKFGVHGGAGLAILLNNLDKTSKFETNGSGINDVYFTLDGRYAYIRSFSSTGLDLSGFYTYAGLLFQF